MPTTPDPQPQQFWATSKGRTVEVLARDVAVSTDAFGYAMEEVDVVAYKFLGGQMVHIRAVSSLTGWQKREME